MRRTITALMLAFTITGMAGCHWPPHRECPPLPPYHQPCVPDDTTATAYGCP